MPGRRTIVGLTALALAAFLAACTAFPGGARIEGYAGPEQALFRGIAYPLPTQEHFAPPVRYIFHIHGMGLTKRDEFHQDLYGLLAEKYPVREPNEIWHDARFTNPVTVSGEGMDCDHPWKDHLDKDGVEVPKPCYFDHFGSFRVDVFKNPRGDEVVRLYTYFWHRDLWRIQEPHLRKDMQRNRLGRPAIANTYLKHEVLDGGLSDAAAYAGPAGDLVRAGIGSVLCTMALDAAGKGFRPDEPHSLRSCGKDLRTGPDVEFSYVTHSLGSRMLFDVLAPRAPFEDAAVFAQPGSARGFLIDRGRAVFMAANQLPLLALARIRLDGDPAGEPKPRSAGPTAVDPLVNLVQTKQRLEGRSTPRPAGPPPEDSLQVIGFQDPDDILGFQASDTYKGRVEFVDVTNRNTGQFLWFLVVPPWAHDQELKHAKTRQMILCGARIGGNGRIAPYECRSPF